MKKKKKKSKVTINLLVMKLNKYILLTLLPLLFYSYDSFAQSDEMKSKAYYFSAQDSYEAENYSKALELLDKSEEAGGASNAYIEALRSECYAKKGEWINAKKSLEKCFNFGPSNEVLKRISPLLITVDEKVEAAKEAERKRIEEARLKELERLERERQEEIARMENDRKNREIAKSLEPSVRRDLDAFKKLDKLKAHLITNRNNFTSSSKEKQYIVFYRDKYIVYIIPDLDKISKLDKDKIYYSSYTSKDKDEDRIYVPRMESEKFRTSVFYGNQAVSDDGNENIIFSGTAYPQFEKRLYYFFWNDYKHCDFDVFEEFKEEINNPYVETGTIEKWIEYDYISDPELLKDLKRYGFKDLGSKKRSNPSGLVIKFKPNNFVKMIYPTKKVTYNRGPEVTGTYWKNGEKYKKNYFFCEPASVVKQVGYVQYGRHYNETDLLPNITESGFDYVLNDFIFDLNYKRYSDNIGDGKVWIHKSEGIYPSREIKKITSSFEYSKDYYSNGILKSLKSYLAGKKSGIWKYYDETGLLVKTEKYEHDVFFYETTEFDTPEYAPGAKEILNKSETKTSDNWLIRNFGDEMTEEQRATSNEVWDDWEQLNAMAWEIYKKYDDPKQIEMGIVLVERSLELAVNYFNLDTHAALLYKNGEYSKAKTEALKALETGKVQKQDVSGTKNLLELINQKL